MHALTLFVSRYCRRRRRTAHRSGFTLVETVIACTVILIVLAGSYQILDVSMNLIRTVRDGYAATTISNARIERARAIPYGDLLGFVENGTIVDDYGTPSTDGRFRRVTTVAVDQPAAGCTKVAVTTDVHQPGKRAGVYYNARTLTGVFTLYDLPP